MNTIVNAAITLATCRVISYRVPEFELKIQRLARRATKLGIPAPVARPAGTVKQPIYATDEQGFLKEPKRVIGYHVWHHYEVEHASMKLPGGWRFLGTIEHVGESNILRLLCSDDEGKRLHVERYRKSKPVCHHCNTNRRRKDTYLVVNETGEVKQVGKSCIKDYLGHDAAKSLSFFVSCMGLGDYEMEGSGQPWYDLTQYVAVAKACVAKHGWTSRGDTYYDTGKEATADTVAYVFVDALSGRGQCAKEAWEVIDQANEEYGDFAKQAVEWSQNIADDCDNTYLLNLRAACSLGAIEPKHFGLVASLVKAFERELNHRARAREAARKAQVPAAGHFGQPGDKIGRKLSKKDRDKGAAAHPTFEASVTFMTESDGRFGLTTIIKLRDDKGYVFTWFKSGCSDLERGDRVTVVGTIKKHDTYRDTPQTVLSRCNLKKVAA